MSDRASTSRPESDSGYWSQPRASANAYRLALRPDVLQILEERRIIDEKDWHNGNEPDFHQRFAVGQYYSPPNAASGPRSSVSSSSSMALTCSQSRMSSLSPPSLTNSTGTVQSESSIATSIGSIALDQNRGLLDLDDDGTARAPASNTQVWQCPYWFLGCTEFLDSMVTWDRHCQGHFHGRDPMPSLPKVVECPFACEWSYHGKTGEEAWRQRQVHVYQQHRSGGRIDMSQSPTPRLIEHLWNKRIITDAQEQELRRYGRLSATSTAYLEAESASRSHRHSRRPGGGRSASQYSVPRR